MKRFLICLTFALFAASLIIPIPEGAIAGLAVGDFTTKFLEIY